MEKVTRTFIDLVKIDSPSGEEDGVRKYLIMKLSSLGIKSVTDKVGNLFVKVDGAGEPVLLSAHMDTVEPGRGIIPKVVNGVVKSDGSTILGADNKAAVAAILTVLGNLPDSHRSLEIVFSVCEETDGGIESFDFNQLKSKIGIAPDRGSKIGNVVLAAPWIDNFEIEVHGRIVHSSVPEKGINALTAASRAMVALEWGRPDKETTTNMGIIHGGSVMNSIPSKVDLTGEVRSFSEKSLEKNIVKIRDTFEKEAKKIGAKIAFRRESYCKGYSYKKTDYSVVYFKKVCDRLKIPLSYEKSFGGSDANSFIAHGISVLNIGEGSKYPHTLREQVSEKDLFKLVELIATYITL
ncbi:MAG: hypothetical protein UT61_C0012G0023 [Candidatus Woesebacteria bacterium GW2011_GWA1_39_8]|uniref:Peptidase M20 dimerisation domain-containing protein n=1 Tax=Candidatus Woesebacteria bacterium GW2011_GWA1_39_8 TaxID=1618552 RepID=A0A0G0PQI4_9BACT|nr:MAG: hypothetical protein UT61_C0012G0023 [Candidatus Woesebacteria bacterium GW2011_GWA1_39_8]